MLIREPISQLEVDGLHFVMQKLTHHMVIKLMAKLTFATYIEHCCSIVDMIVIISAPHHTAGSVKKRWDNNALAAV